MEASWKSVSQSVKRWQLGGADHEPRRGGGVLLSSWTPLHHKHDNLQLFEERVNLVQHWFDLWTGRQRKQLLHRLLARCAASQLKYFRDLLVEVVPVTRVDFTAVLPRFLSLYVMSFLSPRDLCRVAQVSWHWRVLAEQDCLWAERCIRRGWFLPYAPAEKEFGAWKSHYVSCVATLDWLTPREAAERYGTLKQLSGDAAEEEEERRMRQMIRDRLQEEKRRSLRTRRAWGSYGKPGGGGLSSGMQFLPSPSLIVSSSLETVQLMTASQSLEKSLISTPRRERLSKARGVLSSFTHTPAASHPVTPPLPHRTSSSLLLLVSNRIPAYEVVLSGVKAGVLVVLYDHRGSLSALLAQAESAIGGQTVRRIGLLAPGGTEEIRMLNSCGMSEKTLLMPLNREFWEKLSGWVATTQEGGGIDVFCPLAASASGVAFTQTLFTLTGLEVLAPLGLATGSFQNILSEWSGLWDQPPAERYVCTSVLQSWCMQAQWMDETLQQLGSSQGPQLQRAGLQARGRALGYYLWEEMCLDELRVSKDLSEALTEGLTALSRQQETRPVEFLSSFLARWDKKKEEEEDEDEPSTSLKHLSLMHEPPQTALDWRGAVARELQHSERLYLARLSSVQKVYAEPLAAALKSNRAILSFADVQLVFSPVTPILEMNRVFEAELQVRLQRWGAEQCVGDVCAKLCSKLRVYTNYFNNYTTSLSTIDKCRETKPRFRAFLKRVDRTLATHMLSLQELLLCPMWRINEYAALLQALSLHTPRVHADHAHIGSALRTMLRLKEFVQTLKRNSEACTLMEETQKMIRGCPMLQEGNRQLIVTQDAALLRSPNETIPESLRTFEHVSDVTLFLFNDALVLTRRDVHHTPFAPSHRSAHTFLASVALAGLSVREIARTRYVSHAFVLEGPRRSWVCATERGEERERFMCVLRSAMTSATTWRGEERRGGQYTATPSDRSNSLTPNKTLQ